MRTVAAAILVAAAVARAGVAQWTPASPLSRDMFDDQTLVKRWTAAVLPGIESKRIVDAHPVSRDRAGQPSNETRSPVRAVRADGTGPAFQLDLGSLAISTYVVRVIAMVPTDQLVRWRKPLYVELTIDGAVYRQRVPYWDDFYAVAEIYFNVDEPRPYTATLRISNDSQVDAYVESIELHDVLHGLANRAAKAKPGTFTRAERSQLRATAKRSDVLGEVEKEVALDPYLRGDVELSTDERAARDDLLWNAVLPPNIQYVSEYDGSWLEKELAPGNTTRAGAGVAYGTWGLAQPFRAAWRSQFALHDSKLGLDYTLGDLVAHRALPSAYPFADRGAGVYFAQTAAMAHPQHWMPIAEAVGLWWEGSRLALAPYHGTNYERRLPYFYLATGDLHAARDAAFMLARWAYLYPALTDAQILDGAVVAPNLQYDRDERLLWRRFGYQRPTGLMLGLLYSYDQLFDYISGNQELARAVGRYIPWIKTDRDLRAMIETRLVQYAAKQILRWNRWDDEDTPSWLMLAAAVEQDPAITRPWLAELWRQTWVYPYAATSLPDLIATTTQRDGTTGIGSVSYASGGSSFAQLVDLSHRWVQNGGDAAFDLAAGSGKLARAAMFPLESSVAGGYPMTTGDVGGVAAPRVSRAEIAAFADNWRRAWRWTHDARAAWILDHDIGRGGETDAEWGALVRAADSFGRDPFLAQSSRVLANWAGILEAGQSSDDYRQKRTVYLRVGTGHGHAHNDTLDLQILANGLRMAGDLGWRPGYAQPESGETMMHDRIEIDDATHPREGNWLGHSWIATLAPLDGAQYMEGIAVPPPSHPTAKSYRRDVALIDAGSGSYVVDIQRIDGGTHSTWCFHGPWSDRFDVNLVGRTDVGPRTTDTSADGMYLRKFLDGPGLKYAGDGPRDQPLVATWRLRRSEEAIAGRLQVNAERAMLGTDYNEHAPPAYLRAHLFDRGGDRVLVGEPTLTGPPNVANTTWPFLYVRSPGTQSESTVYPAIYEPYRDQPLLARAVPDVVADAGSGADRAVALAITTADGGADWIYSDGDPSRARAVGPNGSITVQAAFAYSSYRNDGALRVLELVDGASYDDENGPHVIADVAGRDATIAKVDYVARAIWIRTNIPAALWLRQQITIGNSAHQTSFAVVAAVRDGGRTKLTLDAPLDLAAAKVTAIDDKTHEVRTDIGPQDLEQLPGMNGGLTLTDDAMTHTWKVTKVLGAPSGGEYRYQIDGDVRGLAVGKTARLWELGTGDAVHLPAYVQLRQIDSTHYRLTANAAVAIGNVHVPLAELAAHGGTLAIELH